jgi:DNA-binding NarL/FixJ family response regulator
VFGCDDRGVGRTILIVDDHAGFRARARALLVGAGYDVVGEAKDGASALARARELSPEVVLLDVQMPDTSGFDVARSLLADPDPPAIILVSSRDASDYGARIGRSGARGFVSKMDLSARALASILEGSG